MSINHTERDAACNKLRDIVGDLQQKVSRDELQAPELIIACRDILSLWLESGGETTDDAVIGFLAIESQSDHVLSGSRVKAGRDVDRIRFEPGSDAETTEINEIAHVFKDSFGRAVAGVAEHLRVR